MITINTPLFVSLLGALALTQEISASRDPAESRRVQRATQTHVVLANTELRRQIFEYCDTRDLFLKLVHVSKGFEQGVADAQIKGGAAFIGWLDKMYLKELPASVIANEISAACLRGKWLGRDPVTRQVGFAPLLEKLRSICSVSRQLDTCFVSKIAKSQSPMQLFVTMFEMMRCLTVPKPFLSFALPSDERRAAYDKFLVAQMANGDVEFSTEDLQSLKNAETIRPDIVMKAAAIFSPLQSYAAVGLMHSLLAGNAECPLAVPPASHIMPQLLAGTVDGHVLDDFMYFVRAATGIAQRLTYLGGRAHSFHQLFAEIGTYFACLGPHKSVEDLVAVISAENKFVQMYDLIKDGQRSNRDDCEKIYTKFLQSCRNRYRACNRGPSARCVVDWQRFVEKAYETQCDSLEYQGRSPLSMYDLDILSIYANAAVRDFDSLKAVVIDPRNTSYRSVLAQFFINYYKNVKQHVYEPMIDNDLRRVQMSHQQSARTHMRNAASNIGLIDSYLAQLRAAALGQDLKLKSGPVSEENDKENKSN